MVLASDETQETHLQRKMQNTPAQSVTIARLLANLLVSGPAENVDTPLLVVPGNRLPEQVMQTPVSSDDP